LLDKSIKVTGLLLETLEDLFGTGYSKLVLIGVSFNVLVLSYLLRKISFFVIRLNSNPILFLRKKTKMTRFELKSLLNDSRWLEGRLLREEDS